MANIEKGDYSGLVNAIGSLILEGRKKALQAVNTPLVFTYWHIGRCIVEFEQKGHEKADYGSNLLKRLSKDLKTAYGKGFSISNVYMMRKLYLRHEKFQTLSGKLSWSHYTELLSIADDLARSFYEKQCESVTSNDLSQSMSITTTNQGLISVWIKTLLITARSNHRTWARFGQNRFSAVCTIVTFAEPPEDFADTFFVSLFSTSDSPVMTRCVLSFVCSLFRAGFRLISSFQIPSFIQFSAFLLLAHSL